MATAELTHDTGIPADVREFAAKHDFTPYLAPLATAVAAAFPGHDWSCRLEPEPELPDDGRIVFEVDVSGFSAAEMSAARDRFYTLRTQACPPSAGAGRYTFRMIQR